MKPVYLSILFLVFFVLVNLQYFWEQNLGMLVWLIWIASYGGFFILGILLIQQILKLVKKDNRSRGRVLSVFLGVFILVSSYVKPYGLIDFQKFEPETLLIAASTGRGNCSQRLYLYVDNTFKEFERCFSTSRTRGDWTFLNDTIYFSNIKKGAEVEEYYTIAVIQEPEVNSTLSTLVRYENDQDSTGHMLWILSNQLDD